MAQRAGENWITEINKYLFPISVPEISFLSLLSGASAKFVFVKLRAVNTT